MKRVSKEEGKIGGKLGGGDEDERERWTEKDKQTILNSSLVQLKLQFRS